VVAGLAGLALGRRGSPGPPVRASGTLIDRAPVVLSPPLAGTRKPHEPRPQAPRGVPRQLTIRAIGVDAPIVQLGVNQDGTLQVPTDFGVAGWYRLGTKPGDRGPAVVVGHVDSESGPGVFYRLGTLARGDVVRVSWKSGASVLFHVYAVREYAKTSFPTSLVYGKTEVPELRLITCGGPFDAAAMHYLDNVVVFARMAPGGVEPPYADSKLARISRIDAL